MHYFGGNLDATERTMENVEDSHTTMSQNKTYSSDILIANTSQQ
jgi:hypothetical protein